MSDKSKQNISELMDGELPNDCSRFLHPAQRQLDLGF